MHFPQGVKELQLSLFQAIVLLLFNDSGENSLPYKEIKQLTNIGKKGAIWFLLLLRKYRLPESSGGSNTNTICTLLFCLLTSNCL